MANYSIENNKLKISFRTQSAEMISVIKKETATEYLWNGDSEYWGWSSPILFPFVGSLRDKTYTYNGKEYHLNQHGFARNQEFALKSIEETSIWFVLTANEVTRENYPFEFSLEVGYELCDNEIKVLWKVTNTDEKTLYYSIGAHPAFMCPLNPNEKQTDCFMGFNTDKDTIQYRLIDTSVALVDPAEYDLALKDGMHQIEADRFDLDALIFEHKQVTSMYLAGADQKPYLTVDFDAPLFGVWSPAKKGAPFVCIEPWYGRADGKGFFGTLEEREYEESAAPGETQEKCYTIIVH